MMKWALEEVWKYPIRNVSSVLKATKKFLVEKVSFKTKWIFFALKQRLKESN